MIASRSAGLRPARSSAVRLASIAICASDSPWRIRKRWPMPVRERIHSSEVSMYRSRSLFVSAVRGTARPVATILEPMMTQVQLWLSGPEGQRGVGATEPERIIECDANFRRARLVGHVVEIAFGVGDFLVDSRRHHPTFDREYGVHRFDRAGRAERMPGHRLGRTDCNLCGALAEDVLYRLCLSEVALLGRGAVSV